MAEKPKVVHFEQGGELQSTVDLYVGLRIRMRRIALDYSEAELAKVTGTTEQQLKEIEAGHQRISPAGLVMLGQVLDVPMAWFFDGLGPEATFGFGGQLPDPLSVSNQMKSEEQEALLLTHFAAITNSASRRMIVALTRKIADLETLLRSSPNTTH